VTEAGTCLTKGCVAGYGNEQFGYARYKASDYNPSTKIWTDSSGHSRNLNVVNGNPTVNTASFNANGATKSFPIVKGGTSDGIQILTETLASYTLFHVARLASGTRGRIFCNWDGGNWLSGFWGGGAGIAYHEDWVTPSSGSVPVDSWLLSSDFKYSYRANGISKNQDANNHGISSLPKFGINGQHEHSDWEVCLNLCFLSLLYSSFIPT